MLDHPKLWGIVGAGFSCLVVIVIFIMAVATSELFVVCLGLQHLSTSVIVVHTVCNK